MQLNASVKLNRRPWVGAGLLLASLLVSPTLVTAPAHAEVIHFEPLPAEPAQCTTIAATDVPAKQYCGKLMYNPSTQNCFRRGGNLVVGGDSSGFCWTPDKALPPRGLVARSYSTAGEQAVAVCLAGGKAVGFTMGKFACVVIPRAVAELVRNRAADAKKRP